MLQRRTKKRIKGLGTDIEAYDQCVDGCLHDDVQSTRWLTNEWYSNVWLRYDN